MIQWLKNEEVAAASSQDLQQETNESKDCGGKSFAVLSMFYYIFGALEDEQLIDIENSVDC